MALRWAPVTALALMISAVACRPDASGSDGETGTGDAGEPVCGVAESPRLVRLTHSQYDNTARDLLGIEPGTASQFLADPDFSGFDNNAVALVVSDRLARDYRRAAEQLAEQIMSDSDQLANLLSCTPSSGTRACAKIFIEEFGRRAYRRPVGQEDVSRHLELYDAAAGSYSTGTSFEQGIRLLIETFLQSPRFLYRIELSTDPDEQLVALDGYEVATRLSYLLWNSAPDDALLAAANDGELDDARGIESQARRLLADDRATSPVDDFHAQWLRVSDYEDLGKDPDVFPGLSETLSDSMKEETLRFIRHVVFELEGDYETLMTADFTFANEDLAPIYGLEDALSQPHQLVSLDPDRRAGLLTQAGFLATHAYPDASSPIHRGVFVQRQVLCNELPDPPPGIDPALPPADEDAKTTRERVELKTSPAACTGCHSVINPSGFAFENFDGVGAWRTKDAGEPVDAAAELPLGDGTFAFEGAVEFANGIAESPQARRCYLTQWYRYGYARRETSEDMCTLDELYERVEDDGLNVEELLVALTQTRAFRYRNSDDCS